MLGEPEIRRIIETVIAASRADQTEVEVFANNSALTRFANNYIHQNVEQTDVDVRVRAVIGQKIGVASTNELSADALARVAATGQTASVSNAASVPVRNLRVVGTEIKTDEPVFTITGTQDLVLAGLLSAPELSPEVRILAACERVLAKDK